MFEHSFIQLQIFEHKQKHCVISLRYVFKNTHRDEKETIINNIRHL